MRKLLLKDFSHQSVELYSPVRSSRTAERPDHCEDVHILNPGLEDCHLFGSDLLDLGLSELNKERVDYSHQRLAEVVVHRSHHLLQEKT